MQLHLLQNTIDEQLQDRNSSKLACSDYINPRHLDLFHNVGCVYLAFEELWQDDIEGSF